MTSIVDRRKVAGVLAILIFFVVVVTMNHFLYLENATHKLPAKTRALDAQPLDDVLLKDEEQKPEMTVQEEIDSNMKARRLDFGKRRKLRKEMMEIGGSGDKLVQQGPADTDGVIDPVNSRYIPRRRVVHLDLKGAPPKISYFKTIFPMLKASGATTLLIEYEDMFPFWGKIANISARNAYAKDDIRTILKWASDNSLDVIPLVQTFGHLEFVLKLEEFQGLREVPYHPQAICPTQNQSWSVITEMIDQVLSLHPHSEWLHVGCDEVFQLARCPLCQKRISDVNSDPNAKRYLDTKTLFLDHVHRVATYVRAKKLIPIIWDDMLRNVPEDVLVESGIGKLVEPMVWVYIEDVDRFVDQSVWANFGATFTHLWVASAFKGAFGGRLYVANMERHVGNNLGWLEVMRREHLGPNNIDFRGIALTGWSRYDHFAVLCELLPLALPSVVLNLNILADGGHTRKAAESAHSLLQCSNLKAPMTRQELMSNPEQWDLSHCQFPGSDLFALMASYDMNRREVEDVYDRLTKRDGWTSTYNVHHRFSSVQRVTETMKSVVGYIPHALRNLREQLKDVLARYFDSFTVDEWLEQHMAPLDAMIDDLRDRYEKLVSRNSWPRRPLTDNDGEAAVVH